MKQLVLNSNDHDVYVDYEGLTRREIALAKKNNETVKTVAKKVAEDFFNRGNTNNRIFTVKLNEEIGVDYEVMTYNWKLRLVELELINICENL